MKKAIIIIAILLIFSAVAWFLVRPMIEPSFELMGYDFSTKTGNFKFGGKDYDFKYNSSEMLATARNEYSVKYYFEGQNVLKFDLYKADKFIKNLVTKKP